MWSPVPPEYTSELARMNEEIERLTRERDAWLDERVAELSPLKVGDEVYDVQTGECLGRVTEIYRLGDGFSSYYRYGNGMNTSCQPGRWFGSKDDVRRHLAAQLERLK